MSGIVQIVGQSSGVSHLLSVDSAGKIACGDSSVLAKVGEVLTKNTAILAKNTEILAKNAEIEVSCNALIAANHVDLVAIDNTLGGTLTISAPVLSATSFTVSNNVSVANSAVSTTASNDIALARRVIVMGNLSDTSGSIKVEISIDNSTFYEDTEQAIYSDAAGNYGKTINCDARYIRFKYSNTSGSAQTFTLLMSYKA